MQARPRLACNFHVQNVTDDSLNSATSCYSNRSAWAMGICQSCSDRSLNSTIYHPLAREIYVKVGFLPHAVYGRKRN